MSADAAQWFRIVWRLCRALYWTIVHSGSPIFFWVKPSPQPEAVPDLSGKVYLVTGANSGVGYQACRGLYNAGATVYLGCRSEKKALQAMDDIRADQTWTMTGLRSGKQSQRMKAHRRTGRLELLGLDLTDLNSVERAAKEFIARESRLDCLIANAGIMATPCGQFTKQGYTLQMGTNVLGHHLLIQLLLPLLQQTSQLDADSPARLLCLSSAGHALAPLFPDWSRFHRSVVERHGESNANSEIAEDQSSVPMRKKKRQYDPWREYGLTKWAAIGLARHVHWAYGPRNAGFRRPKGWQIEQPTGNGEIIAISIHPGMVATDLWVHFPFVGFILKYLQFTLNWYSTPADIGAVNVLYSATCPADEARRLSGGYIVPYRQAAFARPDTEDPRRVERMWQWCEEQVQRWI